MKGLKESVNINIVIHTKHHKNIFMYHYVIYLAYNPPMI